MVDHQPSRVERRLVAMLAADVVGFSKLTGADEEHFIGEFRKVRTGLVDPTIARYGGQIVNTAGDSILAEFRSVVEAVRAAIVVQNAMAARNLTIAADKRIEFRIGINLGDVLVEADGNLMGDGVNVTARLEGIADRGGIFVSEDVYRQVRGKIAADFTDLGQKKLKNIANTIKVYRIEFGRKILKSKGEELFDHFATSTIFGLVFTLLFFIFPGYVNITPIDILKLKLYDIMTNISMYEEDNQPSIYHHPIVFLDIDDSSMKRITGSPNVVPRRYLGQLIAIAKQAKAKAIVLDFDISASGPDDALLRAAVETPLQPTVILDRSLTRSTGIGCSFPAPNSPVAPIRLRSLETSIADKPDWGAPNRPNAAFAFGNSEFELDQDDKVRRFCFATLAADHASGTAETVLSMPAAALQAAGAHWPALFRRDPLLIRFRFADRPESRFVPPNQPLAETYFRRISAYVLLEGKQPADAERPLAALLSDAIVIIGESQAASADFHETPLGLMPGPLLIANAIDTLQRNINIDVATPLYEFALQPVLTILSTLAFTFFYWKPITRFHAWEEKVANSLQSFGSYLPFRFVAMAIRCAAFVTLTLAISVIVIGVQLLFAAHQLVDGAWLDLSSSVIGILLDTIVGLYREIERGIDVLYARLKYRFIGSARAVGS